METRAMKLSVFELVLRSEDVWSIQCDFDSTWKFDQLTLKNKGRLIYKRFALEDVCFIHFIYIHRYGIYLGLLKEEAANDLALLIKHVKIFLSTQRVETSSELSILYRDHTIRIHSKWTHCGCKCQSPI